MHQDLVRIRIPTHATQLNGHRLYKTSTHSMSSNISICQSHSPPKLKISSHTIQLCIRCTNRRVARIEGEASEEIRGIRPQDYNFHKLHRRGHHPSRGPTMTSAISCYHNDKNTILPNEAHGWKHDMNTHHIAMLVSSPCNFIQSVPFLCVPFDDQYLH